MTKRISLYTALLSALGSLCVAIYAGHSLIALIAALIAGVATAAIYVDRIDVKTWSD